MFKIQLELQDREFDGIPSKTIVVKRVGSLQRRVIAAQTWNEAFEGLRKQLKDNYQDWKQSS